MWLAIPCCGRVRTGDRGNARQPHEAQRANWLPSPKGGNLSLYIRAYWPNAAIVDGL
jgi:hypothetical protein